MNKKEKRRHVVYGIADSYFQALPNLARSAALAGNLRHPILQGREDHQSYTVEEAKGIVNRILRLETQHRVLVKEKLSAIMGLEEIMYMPGETQEAAYRMSALPFPTERTARPWQSDLAPVNSGDGRPGDRYDNLPMVDKQALRLIAVFMNRMIWVIKALEMRVENKGQPDESNSNNSNNSSDSNEVKRVPATWLFNTMEEHFAMLFGVRGLWLNVTKDGTCFRKRSVDYC